MQDVVKKSTEPLPTYCCIAILESCFMHCKMCYKWLEDVNVRKPDEPALEKWKQTIFDLAQLCRDEKPQINHEVMLIEVLPAITALSTS